MAKESTRPTPNILPAKKVVVIQPTKLSLNNCYWGRETPG